MSTNNITLNYHKCHHFQRAFFSSKLDGINKWILQAIPAEGKCPHILILSTCKKYMQNALRNLRVFCIYFLQVLKLENEGIACKFYFLMPSNFDEKMPFVYDDIFDN